LAIRTPPPGAVVPGLRDWLPALRRHRHAGDL